MVKIRHPNLTDVTLAQVLAALGNPVRLRIVQMAADEPRPCANEAFGDPTKHPNPIRLLVFGLQLVGERMHDDFCVGIPLEVIVTFVEQLFLEFVVIGQLAIEREGKPLRLPAMVARLASHGVTVDGGATMASCWGEAVDYGWAIDSMPFFDAPGRFDLHAAYSFYPKKTVTKTPGDENGNLSNQKVGSPGYVEGGSEWGTGFTVGLEL